jgi:hypothetical protein
MRGEAKLTRFLCRETPSAGPLAQVPKVPSSRNFGPTTMDLSSGISGTNSSLCEHIQIAATNLRKAKTDQQNVLEQ